jgi:hypothetical protein
MSTPSVTLRDLSEDAFACDNFIAVVEGEVVGSGRAAYHGPGVYLAGGDVADSPA